MSLANRAPSDPVDAAAVLAARERIVGELGALAGLPMTEDVVEQMRHVLDADEMGSPAVRAAVRRMPRPGETRPNLVVVDSLRAGGDWREREESGRNRVAALVSGGDSA